MTILELASKLRIETGQTPLILNAPASISDLKGILPPNKIEAEIVSGSYTFIHLFVTECSELQQWAARVISLLSEDKVFWISYPEQISAIRTDLRRDRGWETIIRLYPLFGISALDRRCQEAGKPAAQDHKSSQIACERYKNHLILISPSDEMAFRLI